MSCDVDCNLHGILAAGIGAEELSESLDAGQAADDLVPLNLVPQGDVESRPENLPNKRRSDGA